MKQSALLLAILLVTAACASSNDGFIDQRANNCAPGQPIEIEAGLDVPGGLDNFGTDATAHVQLSNNSDDDLTVQQIRVEPRINSDIGYQLDHGSISVNKVLKEAESERYEIPISVRRSGTFMEDRRPPVGNARTTTADLDVIVLLSDGASYRCRFRVVLPLTV